MAGKGKGGNTVAAVWEIAAPVAEQLGLSIWDIRFQKEGVSWYLRIYIDKEGGVGITDCENFSRAVDGIAVLLLELEQLFLLLFGLILVLFLDVGDHRLESGHLGHALLLASASAKALSKATTTA